MIKETKHQQRNLSLCWIDLANAYGSVQHRLIYLALEHLIYHFPATFIRFIRSMYSNLFVLFITNCWCTDPFPLQIGIFQGEPLSVMIFNLVINLLVEFIQEFYSQLFIIIDSQDLHTPCLSSNMLMTVVWCPTALLTIRFCAQLYRQVAHLG